MNGVKDLTNQYTGQTLACTSIDLNAPLPKGLRPQGVIILRPGIKATCDGKVLPWGERIIVCINATD
ncbi:hypothetical protein GW781_00985 [bacterium]|nr:hypothetical protein [bacterium]